MLFTTPPLSCSLLFLAASIVRRRRTSLLRPLLATSPHSDRELLVGILSRAERTLSQRIRFGEEATRSDSDDNDSLSDKDADSDAVDTAVSSLPLEIRDTLRDLRQSVDRREANAGDSLTPASAPPNIPEVNVNQGYGKNPTITTTALAHLLWKQVLRPGLDSAIDATAGNGGDSVVMANLLFPSKADNKNTEMSPNYSELVSVDIQPEACRNTRNALTSILSPQQLDTHVQIVQGSHAPLPMPHNTSSIALVAYNLGYLPKTQKTIATETASTLQSLTDAVLCLRVGGLLSIVTYPRSNPQEDWAVHVFVEGLALFTSDTHDWRDFVQTVAPVNVNNENDETVRAQVQAALERVWEDQQPQMDSKSKPTWRVHQHKKLGWIDAPILLTAVRIK